LIFVTSTGLQAGVKVSSFHLPPCGMVEWPVVERECHWWSLLHNWRERNGCGIFTACAAVWVYWEWWWCSWDGTSEL